MKILLVSTKPGLAGVETLIKRMVDYLSNQKGIQVSLLFMSKGKNKTFLEPLQGKCKVYFGTDFLSTYSKLKSENFDYVYAFSLFPLIYACMIHRNFLKGAKLSCGVYHPLEFCWKHGPNAYIRKIAHKILKVLPVQNIFFMNEGMQETHSTYLKTDYSHSPLFPVAVDTNRFKKVVRNPKREKIISLGRLVNFRTYIFQMIDVCCELRRKNPELLSEFHIYGDGPLKQKLQDYIKLKSASEFIFTYGEVPYDELEQIFQDAFLCIGGGTAFVEAAAAGVPTLLNICSLEEPLTYGFFYEMKNGYNIGEVDNKSARYFIYDKILELYKMSSKEYQNVERLCQEHSQIFSINCVMKLFIEHLGKTRYCEINFKYYDYFLFASSYMYWKIKNMMGLKTVLSLRYCENDG